MCRFTNGEGASFWGSALPNSRFSILEKAALFGNFSEQKFPCLGLANRSDVMNEHH